MHEAAIAALGRSLDGWTFHEERFDRPLEGVHHIEGLVSTFYRRTVGDTEYSLGRFELDGEELFRAWGRVADEHCSFNAVLLAPGVLSEPCVGCPQIAVGHASDGRGILTLAAQGCSIIHFVTLSKG